MLAKIVTRPQQSPPKIAKKKTFGRFGYFISFLLGRREGGSPKRWRGGGGRFFIENPKEGGGSPGRVGGGGARGWEGVCGEFGGGGENIFCWGRNVHQETHEKKSRFGVSVKGLCQRVPENTRESQKMPQIRLWGYSLLFQAISETFLQNPKETLLKTLLRFWPGDSCTWSLGSQG